MSGRSIDRVWDRPASPPHFRTPGDYLVMVAGSAADFTKSASAFRVIPPFDDPPLTRVVDHDESDSTNERGRIAAVAMALETIPAGSAVLVLAREANIVGALNGWLEGWARNGWVRSGGGKKRQPVRHQEIWRRVLDTIRERGLTVTGQHEPKDGSKFDPQLYEMAALASAEANRIFDVIVM